MIYNTCEKGIVFHCPSTLISSSIILSIIIALVKEHANHFMLKVFAQIDVQSNLISKLFFMINRCNIILRQSGKQDTATQLGEKIHFQFQ